MMRVALFEGLLRSRNAFARRLHVRQLALICVDRKSLSRPYRILQARNADTCRRCYMSWHSFGVLLTSQKEVSRVSQPTARRLCDDSGESIYQDDDVEVSAAVWPERGQRSRLPEQKAMSMENMTILQSGDAYALMALGVDLPSSYLDMYARRVAEIGAGAMKPKQLVFFLAIMRKLWQKQAEQRKSLSSSLAESLGSIKAHLEQNAADFDRPIFLHCLSELARFPSLNVNQLLAKARENLAMDSLADDEVMCLARAFSIRRADDKSSDSLLHAVAEAACLRIASLAPGDLVDLAQLLAYASVRNKALFEAVDRQLCSVVATFSDVHISRLLSAFVMARHKVQHLPLESILREKGKTLIPRSLVTVIHCCGQSGLVDKSMVSLLRDILADRLAIFPRSVLPLLASALAQENVRSVDGVEDLAAMLRAHVDTLLEEFGAKDSCYLIHALQVLGVCHNREIDVLTDSACRGLQELSTKDLALLLHTLAKQSNLDISKKVVRKVKSAMEKTNPDIQGSSLRTVLTLAGSLSMLGLLELTDWVLAISGYVEQRLNTLLSRETDALSGVLRYLWHLNHNAPELCQSVAKHLDNARIQSGNVVELRKYLNLATFCCHGNIIPSSLPKVLPNLKANEWKKLSNVQDRFSLMRLHAFSVSRHRTGLNERAVHGLRNWCIKMVRHFEFMDDCAKHLQLLVDMPDSMRCGVNTAAGSFVDIALLLNQDGFPVSWDDHEIVFYKVSKALLARRKVRAVAFCSVPKDFTSPFAHRPLGMVTLALRALEAEGWTVIHVDERIWIKTADKEDFLRSLLAPFTAGSKDN